MGLHSRGPGRHKAGRSDSRGMTIVEVLIAGAILLVIVLAMMDVSMLGFRSEKTATTKTLLTVTRNQAESVLGPVGCPPNFDFARAGAFDPSNTSTAQPTQTGFAIHYVANASTVPPTLSTAKVVGTGDKIGTWEVQAIQLFFRGVVDAANFKYNVDIIIKAAETGTTKVFGSQSRDLTIPAIFTMDSGGVGAKVVACSAVGGGGGGDGVPSGAVMAFDSATCPSGWSDYTTADGRVIVGTGTYADCSDGGTPCGVSLSVPGCAVNPACTPTITAGCPQSCITQTPLSYSLNNKGGQAKVKLDITEAPAHMHNFAVRIDDRQPGGGAATLVAQYMGATPVSTLVPTSCAGGGCGNGSGGMSVLGMPMTLPPNSDNQAHENRPPYVALKYCKKN